MATLTQIELAQTLTNIGKLHSSELVDILKYFKPNSRVSLVNQAALQFEVETLLLNDEDRKVSNYVNSLVNRGTTRIKHPSPPYYSPEYKRDAPVQEEVRKSSHRQSRSVSEKKRPKKDHHDEIRFVPLPFYDNVTEILRPTILHSEQDKGYATINTIDFTIPKNFVKGLRTSLSDSLPRYEVQLRMILHKPGKEQLDAFPNRVKVTMNELHVNLPPIVRAPHLPGEEVVEKRESKPVDLTSYFIRNADVKQKVHFEWKKDTQSFVVGIWLVRHINWEALQSRFLENGAAQYTKTQEMIKLKLSGKTYEDDITMDSLKISLLCPFTRTKILIPVRSHNCDHIQCFDLSNYLRMNDVRPTWKCPICNKKSPYDSLVIDRYFDDVIKKVDKNVTEIQLLANGNWKVIGNETSDTEDLSGETRPSFSKSPAQKKGSEEVQNEVITLDDSDSEEIPPMEVQSPEVSRKRKHQSVVEDEITGIPTITLDDSDDD